MGSLVVAELKCLPLRGLVDPPLFPRSEGSLSVLQNMRIRPGGYAEARGGIERIRPSGGTAVAPIGAGGISAGIEVSTSFGWMRGFNKSGALNAQYSDNRQLWIAPALFISAVVDTAEYFGADQPFNRIGILMSVAAVWSVTLVYEYHKSTDGSGIFTGALTTSETINFATAGVTQYASWTIPTDWTPTVIGDSGTGFGYRYWMRIRISAVTSVTTAPNAYQMLGFWPGVRDFYVVSTDPMTAVSGAKLMRYGQDAQSGGNAWWQTVTNASALYSNPTMPHRMAAYRGRLFLVNGKDQRRWDGTYLDGIGINPTVNSITVTQNLGTGTGFLGAGIWRYYTAYGYGPVGDFSAQPVDPISSYGVSRAKYQGEITTTANNETVTLSNFGSGVTGVSAMYIYRTQDLTNVPTGSRPTFPAFLLSSVRVVGGANTWEVLTYTDQSTASLFPPVEAVLYDNSPPNGGKYLLVYQNRLFLGTDEAWYWSDAFKPDVFNRTFNNIVLARALGGRNMGGAEFADQAVLFTEDQTWGLRSVELDVPQLYPIHPTIGCVAPDSVATGDGLIIWLARDGFYAWNGGKAAPVKISEPLRQTFAKMNYEAHGGTRGVIHNRRYDVRLMSPGGVSLGLMYSYDLETGAWGTYLDADGTSTRAPICVIHAPLGHADAGVPHPIFAKVDPQTGGGFDYHVYVGEYTTQDHTSNFICSATMHFPQPPGQLFSPFRALAYYQSDAGWGTPALAAATTDPIGSSPGTVSTGTPDTGDDYSVIGGTFSSAARGTSDVKLSFSATTVSGGGVGNQRLFGAVIEGTPGKIRRGAV